MNYYIAGSDEREVIARGFGRLRGGKRRLRVFPVGVVHALDPTLDGRRVAACGQSVRFHFPHINWSHPVLGAVARCQPCTSVFQPGDPDDG